MSVFQRAPGIETAQIIKQIQGDAVERTAVQHDL